MLKKLSDISMEFLSPDENFDLLNDNHSLHPELNLDNILWWFITTEKILI